MDRDNRNSRNSRSGSGGDYAGSRRSRRGNYEEDYTPIIVGREISENVHLLMITPKKVHIPSAFRTFMKIDLLKTLILKTNPAARRNIW